EKEIEAIRERVNSPNFELIIVYGRRRMCILQFFLCYPIFAKGFRVRGVMLRNEERRTPCSINPKFMGFITSKCFPYKWMNPLHNSGLHFANNHVLQHFSEETRIG
ncbi:hypothetical protein, partial [Acidianus sp. RZ1]|uniref:hypothetical protein n=1 Tax=Acidianus sp. RZ1 TaxID=1540082 RepID=UPI001C101184